MTTGSDARTPVTHSELIARLSTRLPPGRRVCAAADAATAEMLGRYYLRSYPNGADRLPFKDLESMGRGMRGADGLPVLREDERLVEDDYRAPDLVD